MRITQQTELGILTAIFIALGLAVMALFSIILFGEFLLDGTVSSALGGVPCLIMPVLVVFLAFISAKNALFFIRSSTSERARRASYFLILFPLVLVGFVIATTNTEWAPSLTFGFPLFIVGAIGFPYAAMALHKEAKAVVAQNILHVRCTQCTYVFEMHRSSEGVLCPYCGQPSINPLMAPVVDVEPVVPPPEGGESDQMRMDRG